MFRVIVEMHMKHVHFYHCKAVAETVCWNPTQCSSINLTWSEKNFKNQVKLYQRQLNQHKASIFVVVEIRDNPCCIWLVIYWSKIWFWQNWSRHCLGICLPFNHGGVTMEVEIDLHGVTKETSFSWFQWCLHHKYLVFNGSWWQVTKYFHSLTRMPPSMSMVTYMWNMPHLPVVCMVYLLGNSSNNWIHTSKPLPTSLIN